MSGTKTFINNTGYQLNVTINIRQGEDPANSAGSQQFQIAPNNSTSVTYGNASNIYLNGMTVIAITDDAVQSEAVFICVRGGTVDNMMNMNSVISINGVMQLTSNN